MRPTKERLEEIRQRPLDNSTVFYERAITDLLAEIDALMEDINNIKEIQEKLLEAIRDLC